MSYAIHCTLNFLNGNQKMEKNEKKVKIVLGDICYPKSQALVIPSNTKGIMSRGVLSKILKDGWKGIEREAKRVSLEEKVEIGDCFSTIPGRLKRRGVKKIYHCVIKRLPSDYTSITIIHNAITKVIKRVIDDGMESITFSGIGIEPGDLDVRSVARVMYDICILFQDKIEIKIIDDNEEFIKDLSALFGDGCEEKTK